MAGATDARSRAAYTRPIASTGAHDPAGEAATQPTTPAGQGRELLPFIAAGTAGAVGERFFECLVEHLALAFGSDVAFVAERGAETPGVARFLACWERGRLVEEPVAYELAGTPCAELGDADVVAHSEGLAERFPHDSLVTSLGLESYLGVVVRDSCGDHVGHVGVLARTPLHADDERLSVLRIFAARAGGEIERRRHERALREREELYRALADEQRALRRVATLVAAGAPQQALFDAVACEVGDLLRADVASLVRSERDGGSVVAAWARDGMPVAPIGPIGPLGPSSATGQALHRGVPARADGLEASTDPAVRRLGVRSAVAAPIIVGGRVWGVIRAGRTTVEPMPDGAEQRLADFAELVAQAIANAEARDELAASRVRMIEAADTERRRIERNLHDGAQQRLVSLRLELALAARRFAADPDAGPVLARASDDLAVALEELRELARGVHPAILTDHGLVAAVQAVAARSPVRVEVEATPCDGLPEVVEATAYYVVAEALTNVAKYAHATVVGVTLRHAGDVLELRIADDGVGGADTDSGSGLRGLIDRVEALGGTLRVASPERGGTVVVATLPTRAIAAPGQQPAE